MVEETITQTVETQFVPLTQVIAYDFAFQISLILIIVGMIGITIAHFIFSRRLTVTKFRYRRTHLARIIQRLLFPSIAIAAMAFGAYYIDTYELFTNDIYIKAAEASPELTPREFFAKILDTGTILISGYVIAKFIPAILNTSEKSIREKEDYERWVEMRGFEDDKDELFYKLFKWVPPSVLPEGMIEEQFKIHLKTEKGRKYLERYRTSRGFAIGSFSQIVKNPFEEWKNSERKKYDKYLKDCLNGKNQTGRKLKLGTLPEEVYTIETWRDVKRQENFSPIIAGGKPPGHSKGRIQIAPRSIRNVFTIGLFFSLALAMAAWWGIDLWLLATASGGLAIAIGFALKETMENYFAYLQIRKNAIIQEGDRIEVDGYNGIVDKISPTVTYVKHGLGESIAIFPTRQMVMSKIINYSKDYKLVPATIKVGVSYTHDPEEVASILVKVGKRIMEEVKDEKGRHLIIQEKCPYLEENLPSCGCDKELLIDVEQPTVRFNEFNESSLDFALWVFVRDYGAQFKVKSQMRIMIYREFKKYGIRIPWPIRTVYQGDATKEESDEKIFHEARQKLKNVYGIGDLIKGGGED